MNHASLGISLIALIPALILCAFIYIKDRVEKEPFSLLTILFLLGAVGYIPALFTETVLGTYIDRAFYNFMNVDIYGTVTFTSSSKELLHTLLYSFLGVALIEETIKWLVLFLVTRKNKNFNCLFDGIVYSTFVSLGFAAIENIHYAWTDGWDTLLLRTITSVPGHLFFGVVMGLLYTLWQTYHIASVKENELIASGSLKKKKVYGSGLLLALSYIIPLIIHGTYSFTNMYSSTVTNIFFYIFVIILYVVCFILINRFSLKDGLITDIAETILKRHHEEGGNKNGK